MKNCTSKYALLLFFAFTHLLLQGCSTAPKKQTKQKNRIAYEKFSNFDKVHIPNDAVIISEMIGVVQPELDLLSREKIASDIAFASKKHKVQPQIMIALVDTESNFKYSHVSSTGDLSLAQVNVDVWNKEFARLKLPLIDKKALVKKDQKYAMDIMGKILAILKKRHGRYDRRWYARYHSNTTRYKLDYLRKIEIRMNLLSQSRSIAMK